MTDDYYEEKVTEEITAKGLKPGDPVGELADPNAQSAAAAESSAGAKADRSGGPGMYRAGGPTTIFGGSGWGPYSDGPLNAVRKSMLNRDGLNEENWMAVAAERTMEASAEWAKLRMENLKVCGGVFGDVERVQRGKRKAVAPPPPAPASGEEGEGAAAGEGESSPKRRRGWIDDSELPLGVYEPQTGIVLCKPAFRILSFVLPLKYARRSVRHAAHKESMGSCTGQREPARPWRNQSRAWRVGTRMGRHGHGAA